MVFYVFFGLDSKNWTRILPFHFFSWINAGDNHSNQFTFLDTPSWYSLSNYFFKTYLCVRGTRYGFELLGFPPGCSSISTGLVFQFHRVPSKRNSYLDSTLYRKPCSSLLKCLLSDVIFLKLSFLYLASSVLHVCHVASSTCLISHSSSFRKLSSSSCLVGVLL